MFFRSVLILALIMTLFACVKDEWVLDENIEVSGVDPSFALPLVVADLNLGKVEQEIDADNFIYNEEEQVFALVYTADVVDLGIDDLNALDDLSASISYEADAMQAAAISSTPAGLTYDVSHTENFVLPAPNGEALDSIIFLSGTLDFTFTSSLPHDIELLVSTASLTQSGAPFSESVALDYNGFTPFAESFSFDLSNYTLDLTDDGTTNNTLIFELAITVTSSGTLTNPGDGIDMEMSISSENISSAWGYFGQVNTFAAEETQSVNLFSDLNGGVLHFFDPKIILTLRNETGIPAQIDFTNVVAPENQIEQELNGPDIDNIPLLPAASFPGDVMVIEHVITNAGTSPTLTSLLDEGPFEITYSSNLTINPDGLAQNFMLNSSRIQCRSDLILPFYGYADNFSLRDTTDLDLAEILNIDADEDFNWEDIKQLSIRMVADNGLPIRVDGQVYFTDSLHQVIDSLFTEPNQAVIEQGFVDFTLPPDDPNFGRVTAETRQVTDIVITREKLKYLLDEGVKRVILQGRSNTNNSSDQEIVRFYPEYNLRIKLSAKLDTEISING